MTVVARAPRYRSTAVPVDVREPEGAPHGDEAGPRTLAGLSRLESAVVEAIAYADVFDWPLTPDEVHRYLPVRAALGEVEAALAGPAIGRFVERSDGFLTLAGRTGLVADRLRRATVSRALWPRAIRHARLVAALPFVRLVAITGSLAVDAADDAADVDLLVVTADGRVWLTRAMSMGVVRFAALSRLRLCPNYLVAESALRIEERSLFTAHELVQMVPVGPSPAYAELLRLNAWFRDFLPNSGPRPPLTGDGLGPTLTTWQRVAEAPLRTALGDRIERWEMRRKVRRLSSEAASTETRYDATCCKGHSEEHGRRSLAAFHARLRELEEAT
jgi:hypothetical protein